MSNGNGYKTVTYTYGDYPQYTFRFYEGFVSEINLRPKGSSETIQVYKQSGVFNVPGGKDPDPETTMTIEGGPDDLDIELDIDDAPDTGSDYSPSAGPIAGFSVRTRASGSPYSPSERRVVPARGASQIASISVRMNGNSGGSAAGASRMFDGGGSGDNVDVTNSAETCPPNC